MQFKSWLEDNRELASLYKSKLSRIEQDPGHHPEGSVFIHSKMVRGAIKKAALILKSYTGKLGEILSNIDFDLNSQELEILVLSAWLHDVGKVTATGLTDKGKIHARGHQDRQHFEPQIQDLGAVASAKARELYLSNRDLVDFLILHHMDFNSGQFSRSFIAEHFVDGKVKNSAQMKLLLILMWADKLGRGHVSLDGHERGLLKSSEISVARSQKPQSQPFKGSPEEMAQMLRQRGLDDATIDRILLNKFVGK